jgi:hypothetical protein
VQVTIPFVLWTTLLLLANGCCGTVDTLHCCLVIPAQFSTLYDAAVTSCRQVPLLASTRGLRASYYPIRAMDNTSPAGKREEVRVRSAIDCTQASGRRYRTEDSARGRKCCGTVDTLHCCLVIPGKREEVRVRSAIDRLRVERHYHACEG